MEWGDVRVLVAVVADMIDDGNKVKGLSERPTSR
jgi:hypothetical protein